MTVLENFQEYPTGKKLLSYWVGILGTLAMGIRSLYHLEHSPLLVHGAGLHSLVMVMAAMMVGSIVLASRIRTGASFLLAWTVCVIAVFSDTALLFIRN